MLKEVAAGCCQPVRVVDMVLLKLYSMPEGGRLLVETGRQYPDGRSSPTYRLPGASRERSETPEETAVRIQHDFLRAGGCSMQFHLDRLEAFTEEESTESLPSLPTLRRVKIVCGHVTCTDEELLAGIGLSPGEPEGSAWSTDLAGGRGTACFSWLTEEQALERRVRLQGDGLGGLATPVLVPMDSSGANMHSTLCESVAEMTRRLDSIFHKERGLLDLEQGLNMLRVWLAAEHSSALHAFLRERARRRYVSQHADQLWEFTRVLGDLERMKQHINHSGLQDLPRNAERLHRLEARTAVVASAVTRLHAQVTGVAEDYHQAMISLNTQLLHWDGLLSNRE